MAEKGVSGAVFGTLSIALQPTPFYTMDFTSVAVHVVIVFKVTLVSYRTNTESGAKTWTGDGIGG
jgi:hypothetical protein